MVCINIKCTYQKLLGKENHTNMKDILRLEIPPAPILANLRQYYNMFGFFAWYPSWQEDILKNIGILEATATRMKQNIYNMVPVMVPLIQKLLSH